MFLLENWGVPHTVHRAELSVSDSKDSHHPILDPSSPEKQTTLLFFYLDFSTESARDSILSDIY